MNKIELFNNNKIEVFDPKTVSYDPVELLIVRETKEMKVILDFKKKECYLALKEEDMSIQIPVILMTAEIALNTAKFTYVLASEPEVTKTIMITEK